MASSDDQRTDPVRDDIPQPLDDHIDARGTDAAEAEAGRFWPRTLAPILDPRACWLAAAMECEAHELSRRVADENCGETGRTFS